MTRILFLCHNQRRAAHYRELLDDAGYEIRSADSFSNGFKLFRSFRPDLTIVDDILPYKSGLEFCRDALMERKDAIFLAMTDIDTDLVRKRGLRSGARLLMLHPFSDHEFLYCVKSLLEESGAESA